MRELRMADLCCGLGGMSLAFSRSGYRCVFACDFDAAACDVYEANHGFRPAGDLAGIDPENVSDHEVCVAGLPCTPYSKAGHRLGLEDARSHVLHGLLRVLARKKPQALLMENVVGLLQHDGGRTFRFLRECLRGLGYEVSWSVLNATEFGGAQHRPRVFVVASRAKPFDFGLIRRRPASRIAGLLESGVSVGWLRPEQYVLLDRPVRQKSGLVFAGFLSGKRLRVPGGDLRLSRTHRQAYRIYSASGVSPTISAQESSGRYWVEIAGRVRRLSRPELQRLQGFPDDFLWAHPGRFYQQLGNSVFIPLVEVLARAIQEQLLGG